MPFIRTHQQYSTRLSSYSSAPSSSALRHCSSPSSPSSMTSTSVLWGLFPYRWCEQIPNITLSEYSRFLDDNEDYDNLMLWLYFFYDLIYVYSKTITMQHLWVTAQWLRIEVDRQQIEVRWLSVEMEGLGLQQELQQHLQTPPPEPFLPEARLPTLYYPAEDQESGYQKSSKQVPIPPTNIITTRNEKPDHYQRQWQRRRWMWQWLLHS